MRKQGSRDLAAPLPRRTSSGPGVIGRKSFSGNVDFPLKHRYVPGTTIEKPPNNYETGIIAILKHPLNLLVLCLPGGIYAYVTGLGESYVFWLNFLAMIPLAKILGDATEELQASLKNDMLAGLLNATFGNAVEMVITVQTLRAGLLDVVKATLLGSVLSNVLLVLGASFLCGGIWSIGAKNGSVSNRLPVKAPRVGYATDGRAATCGDLDALRGPGRISIRNAGTIDMAAILAVGAEGEGAPGGMNLNVGEKIQSFSVLGALVNTSMLLISCMSFSLITVFQSVNEDHSDEYRDRTLLPVSRISSIIIMMAYVAYIVFQLVTHRGAMNDTGGDEGEDDGVDHLSVGTAVLLLFFTTVIVAICSELLVDAIKGMSEGCNLSTHFIGIILLPFVGNACEHAAAVRFAVQDKLGLSVSIAIGSSTQIALFVVPFSVLAGWFIGVPMDLNFGTLNTSMITLSVVVVLSMVVDGQSNWLQGYLLCSVYVIIAVMYAYLPDHGKVS